MCISAGDGDVHNNHGNIYNITIDALNSLAIGAGYTLAQALDRLNLQTLTFAAAAATSFRGIPISASDVLKNLRDYVLANSAATPSVISPPFLLGYEAVGTLAFRPTPSASNAGLFYLATDTGITYRSTGSTWVADENVTYAPIFGVAAPTGVAATDQANIVAQVARAHAAGGGEVGLSQGVYAVSSLSRSLASVTYNAGTWTVVAGSVSAADVGRFVLGGGTGPGNANPIGMQNGIPMILTVNTGAGTFTTDRPPVSTVTTAPLTIIAPAIVLPSGVSIKGAGRFATSSFNTGAASIVTTIADGGTGPTVLVRGEGFTGYTGVGTGYNAEVALKNLALWGTSVVSPTVAGTATFGLFVGNNAWWVKCENVDFSWYGQCGVATDGNVNSCDFRNCSFQNNGTAAATVLTGGVITHYFWGAASAECNFDNCLFFQNFGVGIGEYIWGAGIGSLGVNLDKCQFASTFTTAFVTFSGYSMVLNGNALGGTTVTETWSENAATGDLWVNGGVINLVGCQFYSQSTSSGTKVSITAAGLLNLFGCYFAYHSGISGYQGSIAIAAGGGVNWTGCTQAAGGTAVYNTVSGGGTGSPTAAQLLGIGTTVGVFLSTPGTSTTAYINP